MEEVLLGILAAMLIFAGGAALVPSLVGMSVVLYRRLRRLVNWPVPGETSSSESAELGWPTD